jgi:hypothetical protein
MDAREFIIIAHANLVELAVGNAAIGLTDQAANGVERGCHYGVGLGLYQAARSLRWMAIKEGIISPVELPESNWKAFRPQAEAQSQGLDPLDQSSACPLGHLAQEIAQHSSGVSQIT